MASFGFSGYRHSREHVPLHNAALKGDWEAASRLLDSNRNLSSEYITRRCDTALHLAAANGHLHFVMKLLELLDNQSIHRTNGKGWTALSTAAFHGKLGVVRVLVRRCSDLASSMTTDGVMALHLAAMQGHKNIVEFLYPQSKIMEWTEENRVSLLHLMIMSGYYDYAGRILITSPNLAEVPNSDGETPLQVLAKMPQAFHCSKTPRILAWITRRFHPKSGVYQLLQDTWNLISSLDDDEHFLRVESTRLSFIAAAAGNIDFLVDLLKRNPDCLYEKNHIGHSIFHIAVMHRHLSIFNLIYEIEGVKDEVATYIDTDGNNMLHLAAKISLKSAYNDITLAPLHMQRQMLWFKTVEEIVQPNMRNMKNSEGQTPNDVLMAEHTTLIREEEQFVKNAASHGILIATLIVTVIITSIFTIPGGFNSEGIPIRHEHKFFYGFPIIQAIGVSCSFSAMLLFAVLTVLPHSTVEHILRPIRLIGALGLLFISILMTMLLFNWGIFFYRKFHTRTRLLALSIPFFMIMPIVLLFVAVMGLARIVATAYFPKMLFKSKGRLIST